jgi:hypothetical protein
LSAGKAFAIVIAGAVLFSAAGGAIGYAIGRLAPGYYRVWFRASVGPDFDPVQLGLGLGLTQGFVGGIVGGLVIVLAVALSSRRRGGAGGEAGAVVEPGLADRDPFRGVEGADRVDGLDLVHGRGLDGSAIAP